MVRDNFSTVYQYDIQSRIFSAYFNFSWIQKNMNAKLMKNCSAELECRHFKQKVQLWKTNEKSTYVFNCTLNFHNRFFSGSFTVNGARFVVFIHLQTDLNNHSWANKNCAIIFVAMEDEITRKLLYTKRTEFCRNRRTTLVWRENAHKRAYVKI